MPREILSAEEFRRLIQNASECRVVRRGDSVKLKLRTPRALYVYKTSKEESESLLKEIKIPVVEF